MARRAFRQVDVFTAKPYFGNPVAVVLDGDGLSTAEMEQITRWTNLSEATFVLPPADAAADYCVRIFTSASGTSSRPGSSTELPFAGHPTLGTCHAWLEHGGTPRDPNMIVQECGAGLVRVQRESGRLAFAAPPFIRYEPAEEDVVTHIASCLRIGRDQIVDAAWVDNGPGWVAVLLADAGAVLALEPGFVDIDLGVAGLHPVGAECAVEVRAFFPRDGSTAEDPVTGSLNAGLARWLSDIGRLRLPYVAAQGTALGRSGRAYVSRGDDGTIWVGGETVTCITGELEA